MNNKTIFPSRFPEEQLAEHCRRVRHVALDMDGTIYLGETLFPYTIEFLDDLKAMGIGYSFLTNNPSKSTDEYLQKLASLGIAATRDELYTTVQATIDCLRMQHPQPRRLFLLGTPGMVGEFERAGFVSTADDPDDVPDAVVVAFDMTLTYERLCRAAWWISRGLPYLATNPDRVCPTDRPTVLVDCGSICRCLEEATGRRPNITLGKPDPGMLAGICRRHNLGVEQIAMVGDRLYTDMEMARRAGALGVLVLSGETTPEQAAISNPLPDITVATLADLGALLKRVCQR